MMSVDCSGVPLRQLCDVHRGRRGTRYVYIHIYNIIQPADLVGWRSENLCRL